MPEFQPFRAARWVVDSPSDVAALVAPPYDVMDVEERDSRAAAHPRNIVRVDYPVERDGPSRYDAAAALLREWFASGVVSLDATPTFSLYRMNFTDDTGRERGTVGVIGALEVVDEGAPGVRPHERTTPKAKTDRLDLTRATRANLSPVWGLSLTEGLSSLLREPGQLVATVTTGDGVTHSLEAVSDPDRIARIATAVSSRPVLIADGHHRYAVSRTYRDERRAVGTDAPAGLTMTLVQELVEEQLGIAAIHRLIAGLTPGEVLERLGPFYDRSAAGVVSRVTLREMQERGALCLVSPDGTGTFLVPRPHVFDSVRELDSARLEHALGDAISAVTYQHGVNEVVSRVRNGTATCAVLIRPVSITEIRRTADTGELMPPKSTFFTPKPLTGMVWRMLDA
ncbi:MAG: hypothetical protein RLZZ305_1129 [Actinomycetota bacterium]